MDESGGGGGHNPVVEGCNPAGVSVLPGRKKSFHQGSVPSSNLAGQKTQLDQGPGGQSFDTPGLGAVPAKSGVTGMRGHSKGAFERGRESGYALRASVRCGPGRPSDSVGRPLTCA